MKVTIGYSVEQKLANLLEFLKDRAMDKVHEDNRDLIADFVEKVLVVEMKHFANNPKDVDETIEIPDDVIMEPMKKAKEQFDTAFAGFLSGNGLPPQTASASKPDEQVTQVDVQNDFTGASTDANTAPGGISRQRNGNGHVSAKVRDLLDWERDTIRNSFMDLNGIIAEDACLPILEKLDDEVAIFQVTGFVSYLHREISLGKLTVADMPAYEAWMMNQRKLWAQYEKNKIKRQQALANASTVATPARTTTPASPAQNPQFVPGFQKRSA